MSTFIMGINTAVFRSTTDGWLNILFLLVAIAAPFLGKTIEPLGKDLNVEFTKEEVNKRYLSLPSLFMSPTLK